VREGVDEPSPCSASICGRRCGGAPNQWWVGDTTEFVIGEHAKLYLAAILDLYSRFVVGWWRSEALRDAIDLTMAARSVGFQGAHERIGLVRCFYESPPKDCPPTVTRSPLLGGRRSGISLAPSVSRRRCQAR
jgi:hypothetical protein